MDSGKSATIAIATIVALVLGGGVGYAVGTGMDDDHSMANMSVSEGIPNSAT